MKKAAAAKSTSASIDEKIKELGDWRGKTLAKVREIVVEADPEIVEERKWAKPTSRGLLSPTAASSAREKRTRTSSR